MTKFKTLFIAVFAAAFVMAAEGMTHAAPNSEVVTVYKQTYCGCCEGWAEHMRKAGFEVNVINQDNMAPINARFGIPANVMSCHTAIVGKYLIVGHVPADDIKKLLEEQPDAMGLAVPGMPIGSPGMEVPGRPAMKYYSLLFHQDGAISIYISH